MRLVGDRDYLLRLKKSPSFIERKRSRAIVTTRAVTAILGR
jgi:hypothetical protein